MNSSSVTKSSDSPANSRAAEPVVFGYPSAAQLEPTFDVDLLLGDLVAVSGGRWDLQRNYTTDGPGKYAIFDWRALPLRSPSGSESRTDPGGAGLDEYGDTHWLDKAPYLRSLLSGIPAPLRTVRLLALAPDAHSKVHFETKIGFPWGNLRLHVPITTNPGASLTIDGITHQWAPGTFWFGDFCRWHQVRNEGTEPRVHMIIDTMLTPELVGLFPDDFRASLSPDDVLCIRPDVPADDPERYCCAFDMPASFSDWEEPDGCFLEAQEQLPAEVRLREDGGLALMLSGAERFRLIHIGGHEFRLAGWTPERTIQIVPGAATPTVILRTRRGSRTRELVLPASSIRGVA